MILKGKYLYFNMHKKGIILAFGLMRYNKRIKEGHGITFQVSKW